MNEQEKEEHKKILHDLNNILCGIYGYTEMLRDLIKDEEELKLFEKLYFGIDRLGNLLRVYHSKFYEKEL